MPTIQIEAIDTLFFKDGRPFSMGEETFAEGMFPPSPGVIYGSLRSAYIASNLKNGVTIKDLILKSESIRITNICYDVDSTTYYPMPLDYVEQKSRENSGILLNLIKNDFSSSNTPFLLTAPEHVEQVSDGLFNSNQIKNYLKGYGYPENITKWKSDVISEVKIGNKRSNITRTTDSGDGEVYRVGMLRLAKSSDNEIKHFRLIVEYDFDSDLPEMTNIIKLGGEGKVAITTDINPLQKEDEIEGNSIYFFIYFFSDVLLEDTNRLAKLESVLSGHSISITQLSWTIGKPRNIGGWDIAAKQPKPMIKAVPAGSVFFYKIESETNTVKDVVQILRTENTLSEFRGDEGFGLYKIGVFDFEKRLM